MPGALAPYGPVQHTQPVGQPVPVNPQDEILRRMRMMQMMRQQQGGQMQPNPMTLAMARPGGFQGALNAFSPAMPQFPDMRTFLAPNRMY
jgi:hypothetical protein